MPIWSFGGRKGCAPAGVGIMLELSETAVDDVDVDLDESALELHLYLKRGRCGSI